MRNSIVLWLSLAVVLLFSGCNLGLSETGTPEPKSTPTLPTLQTTLSAATWTPNTTSPTLALTPMSTSIVIDEFAKMTNFVDSAPTMSPVIAPETETLKCGIKYTISYPGINSYNKGVWFYMGSRYGFTDTSLEMTTPGYFSEAYMNWVGTVGSYSPGFDGRSYKARGPVSFPFFLPCQAQ